MADDFKYCPQCGGEEIEETDYENEDGSVDEDGRRCAGCRWEGSVDELVCK